MRLKLNPRWLSALNLAGVVLLWIVLRPDLERDWPVLLLGVALGAAPLVVAVVYIRIRGKRLGKLYPIAARLWRGRDWSGPSATARS